jgi:protein-disulfide isomerase
MRYTQSRARLILLGVALLVVALLAAACGGGGQAPAPTQPPGQATAPAAATQPSATQAAPGESRPLDLPAGVDADGNFYLGDPNAPVKMVEWSDFQ